MIQCKGAKWSIDSQGAWLCLLTDRFQAAQAAESIKDGIFDIQIKKHREKRSMDANSYLWVLLDNLASVLHTTKEELYRQYIRQVGIFKDFHFLPDEAKTFRVAWGSLGTGWITEQVDYDALGEQVLIRAYYGSSQYNTKQMSRLIDMVVSDCKAQDIDTMTPDQLEALKSRWQDAQTHKILGNQR